MNFMSMAVWHMMRRGILVVRKHGILLYQINFGTLILLDVSKIVPIMVIVSWDFAFVMLVIGVKIVPTAAVQVLAATTTKYHMNRIVCMLVKLDTTIPMKMFMYRISRKCHVQEINQVSVMVFATAMEIQCVLLLSLVKIVVLKTVKIIAALMVGVH